ncbi:hypothetical protein ACHAPQ_009932 [Fusarium lateritium]
MAIENVAVVGGSGLLGSKVVNSLLKAGFNVTAITRNEFTAKFPSKVTVKRVDITSIIIDAAIAARVPRFIPSEFGIPSRENRDTKIGRLLATKVQNTDYLIELAEKHDWSLWTGLANSLSLDAGLRNERGFVNIKERKFRLVDSGNEPYSTSTLAFIGDAVATILKKPVETANKYLNIAGVTTTQNEVLEIVEEITRDKFEVSRVSSAELEKTGDEKIAKGDSSTFGDYLEQFLFADGAGHSLTREMNA